jgi:hypothetical protein
MTAPAPLPETIDEVLARLNGVLDTAIRQGQRIGYFVAWDQHTRGSSRPKGGRSPSPCSTTPTC